jgi:hypothetical protein
VDEDVLTLVGVLHLIEAFNATHLMFKAGGKNEGLISELFTVGDVEGVSDGVDLGDLHVGFNLGPGFDLGGEGTRFDLELGEDSTADTEVCLGLDELVVVGNDCELEVVFLGHVVLLCKLDEGSCINTT